MGDTNTGTPENFADRYEATMVPVVFGALFGLALLVGVLVGLLPAWRVAVVEPGLQIKSE